MRHDVPMLRSAAVAAAVAASSLSIHDARHAVVHRLHKAYGLTNVTTHCHRRSARHVRCAWSGRRSAHRYTGRADAIRHGGRIDVTLSRVRKR